MVQASSVILVATAALYAASPALGVVVPVKNAKSTPSSVSSTSIAKPIDKAHHGTDGRLGEHDRLHPSQGHEHEHRLGMHETDSRHPYNNGGSSRLHELEREHSHGLHPLDGKHTLTGKKMNAADVKNAFAKSSRLPVPAHGLDKHTVVPGSHRPLTSKTSSLKKPDLKVHVPTAAQRNSEINQDFSNLEKLIEQRYRRQEPQEAPMTPATPETPATPDSAIASTAGAPAHKHKKHGHKHGKHSHKKHHHHHKHNSSAMKQAAVAEPASPMDPSAGAPLARSWDDDEMLELVARAFYDYYDDLD